MNEEVVHVHVPSRRVADVARFLSLVGFVLECQDDESASPPARTYVCSGKRLLLSDGVPSPPADIATAISLPVSDPEQVASRCWSAGHTVEAEDQPADAVQLTVVGPCGFRITLERAAQ